MENNPDIITPPLTPQDILSHLQWYLDAGVDETIDEAPLDWFALSAEAAKASANSARAPQGTPQPIPGVAAKPATMATVEQTVRQAQDLANSCQSLAELEKAIATFDGCSLKKTATNTVVSDGSLDRKIMVIGEVPGVADDRHGKPFVGDNGVLLDKMFAAIGLSRDTDLYLTNMLPWRPPGNRTPTAEEIAICQPFVTRHIALAKPGLIILLGGISAKTLLNSDLSITRLRGKWAEYDLAGQKIPACPIYHPSYLIKQPKAKADAWKDLLDIKARIEEMSL